MDELLLAIGTRKGLFLARRGVARWELEGPLFPMEEVAVVAIDERGPGPRLLVGAHSPHWGPSVFSSVAVRLPASLRHFAGGQAVLRVELAGGGDVGALLDGLARRFPALERRLRDEQGRLRPHVNLFLGTTSIRDLDHLATALPDGAEVSVLPAVSGGAGELGQRAPITDTPEWRELEAHYRQVGDVHLRTLFASDPTRGEAMTVEAGDLYLDYSKNRLTGERIRLLVALAERAGLRRRIEAMFAGERINVTEDRSVLHVALRMPEDASLVVDGEHVVAQVHGVLRTMAGFAQQVRSGQWRGFTGRAIRSVVNIGIGGSDLGPAMAYEALKDYSDRSLTVRFVSNVDGADIFEDPRPRPGRDALRGVLEDVHHHRDPDQRPHGAALAARRLAR